jgi:hypothetical protein
MKDADRSRLDPTLASAMLRVCIEPACSTIVFGGGTCVEHDRPTPLAVDPRLAEDANVVALPARS